jgi:hypothetical protein
LRGEILETACPQAVFFICRFCGVRARRLQFHSKSQGQRLDSNYCRQTALVVVDLDNTSEYRNGSANVLVMETDLAQLANDRFEISDALHRYAFGLDHGDADSLASALTEDCRFDFRPAGRKLEIDFPLLIGRDVILNAVLPLIGPLDTSHSVSNLQIEIVGDTATLYAYVLSQHFMPREGSRRGSEYALLMNRYDCNLMRDRDKWRFKRMTIDNAWALGNPEILNALASRLALRTKSKKIG